MNELMHKSNKIKLRVAKLYESEARSELNMYHFSKRNRAIRKISRNHGSQEVKFLFNTSKFFIFLYYNDAIEFMATLARSSSTDLSMISESSMVMEERIVKLEESTTWVIMIEERIAKLEESGIETKQSIMKPEESDMEVKKRIMKLEKRAGINIWKRSWEILG